MKQEDIELSKELIEKNRRESSIGGRVLSTPWFLLDLAIKEIERLQK